MTAPLISMVTEPEKKIPIASKVNVVVIGGGPAGSAAAIASARNGANTLLIERYGYLGGMSTGGYVTSLPTWNLIPWRGEEKPLIGGIAQEIVNKLVEVGASIRPSDASQLGSYKMWFPFDAEMMKLLKMEMVEDAGAKLFLNSFVTDAIVKDDTIKGVIVENKSGRQAVLADIVIDATGDGDVAARAGAPFEKSERELLLPVTLCFHLGNVDNKKAQDYLARDPDLSNLFRAKAPSLDRDQTELFPQLPRGTSKLVVLFPNQLPLSFPNRKFYVPLIHEGEWGVFGAHYKCDITDAVQLTEAEIATRKTVKFLYNFFRENLPGFESSYIASTAPQLGLRDSRRIMGGYVLTKRDILNGSKFDDAIARSKTGELDLTDKEPLPPYDIPFKCIVPRKIDGLLVAGRCISMDNEAATFWSPREIATCWATGQAAGTAAALAAIKKIRPRELKVPMLQKKLVEQDVNLGSLIS